MTALLSCPLCAHHEAVFYFQDKKRPYYHCHLCDLVFVASKHQLSANAEKAEYDKHENDLVDEGYLKFLSRMYEPIHQKVKANSLGLDFGCGPAPALANKLSQLGHDVNVYDIYYAPNNEVLTKQYDFITCTEVIEHLASPTTQFELLIKMLKPDGILGIMTKLVLNKERFANWHYKNDPTHISFFSRKTFEYLAKRYELKLEFIGQDVMIFTKVR